MSTGSSRSLPPRGSPFTERTFRRLRPTGRGRLAAQEIFRRIWPLRYGQRQVGLRLCDQPHPDQRHRSGRWNRWNRARGRDRERPAAANVPLNPVSPALFLWPQNYVVATHLDYSPAVKNGVLSGETTQNGGARRSHHTVGSRPRPREPPGARGYRHPSGRLCPDSGNRLLWNRFTNCHRRGSQAGRCSPLSDCGYRAVDLAPGDYAIGLEVNGDVGPTGLLTVASH
jgi:hypothetical protein